MGVWGTAIKSNDTFADVYSEFFDLYNDGIEVTEITSRLISENREMFENSFDSHNFWFALALAQWKCAQLEPDVLNRVKGIIENGADLKEWKEMDASEKDLAKREIALSKFLSEISTLREKPLKRIKKKIPQPLFNKGDCLAYRIGNKYGGAIVLESLKDNDYNLIALTRINMDDIPSKKDFEKAEVLVVNFDNWNDTPGIFWLSPLKNENIDFITKVCVIDVLLDYTAKKYDFSFTAGFHSKLTEKTCMQFESEKLKPKPLLKIMVRTLTGTSKWKFW